MFEQTVQKSVDMVGEVARYLHVDPERGYRALRAVLRVIRDAVPPVTATKLAAQLPMLLRGMYFEGWRPNERAPRLRDPDELLDRVRDALGPPDRDPDGPFADDALDAVLRVLAHHLTPGELRKVLDRLPSAVRRMCIDATGLVM